MKKRLAAGAAVVALFAAGGTTAVVVTGDEAVAQAVDAFCAEFVPEIEQVPYHGKWLAQNPGERAQWEAFRDARCAGGEPEPPVLESHYGRALIAAGKRQPSEPPVTTTETTTTTVTEPTTTTDTTETTTTDTEPPPPPPSEGFSYPASFHIFGGNEATAMQTHDLVVSSFFTSGNPNEARANGNPTLTALSHSNLDPFHTDFCFRRGFALTYGSGLQGGAAGNDCADQGKTFAPFAGVTDALEPNPVGAIKPFSTTDFGCTQLQDDIRGFNLGQPATARMVGDAAWYSWKLGPGSENGWSGVWSDNLIPSNILHANWFYGSCATSAYRAAWATGWVDVLKTRLSDRGVPLVGGNGSYRAATDAERRATQVSLNEALEAQIAQGATAYANFLTEMLAWQRAQDGPSYCATMHIVSSTDAAMMRFGLALSTIAGCAYMPYSGNHSSLYLPAEMTRNGQRHYLGRPSGDPVRSGNTWSRNFRDDAGVTRTVTANYDTKTATFG